MPDSQVSAYLSRWNGVGSFGFFERRPSVPSTLSGVLEPSVSPRFFLSPQSAQGILRRADRRGRQLPAALDKTLRLLAVQAGPLPDPARSANQGSPQPSTDAPATDRGETRAPPSSESSPPTA